MQDGREPDPPIEIPEQVLKQFEWYMAFANMAEQLEKDHPDGWTLLPVPKSYETLLEGLRNIESYSFWVNVRDGKETETQPFIAKAVEVIRLIMCPTTWVDIKSAEPPPGVFTTEMEFRLARYWRCWPNGTWDSGVIPLPKDTPDYAVETALKQYVSQLEFTESPVHFGFECWVEDIAKTPAAAA
jgi:hypothetical protein